MRAGKKMSKGTHVAHDLTIFVRTIPEEKKTHWSAAETTSVDYCDGRPTLSPRIRIRFISFVIRTRYEDDDEFRPQTFASIFEC